MDKTLADCWAYLQRRFEAAWYFSTKTLALSGEPGIRPWRESPATPGVIEMTADTLRDLAGLATMNAALDGP